MADELFDTLMRFHREVVQPELDEIRSRLDKTATRDELQATRDEMQGMRGEMATKTDLQAVRGEMATKTDLQAMRAEMATKTDLQAVRAEMATHADLQTIRADMITWPVLMDFFAKMVMPEIENVRTDLLKLLRSEILTHIDGIYVIVKHLQSEYHALTAAVGRLEKQMAEQIADRAEVRSELLDLKNQVSQISDRIAEIGRETN